MKSFILILLTIGPAYSQENCSSLDKRSMVEQLDCFCSSGNKSIIQQKTDKLGLLNREFEKQYKSDCNTAVVKTLTVQNATDINSDVSKKLKSLKYSDEQINTMFAPIMKRVDTAKLINSGKCSKRTLTVSVWPLNYKSNQPPECEALNKMDPAEREAAQMLSIYMNPMYNKSNSGNKELEEVIRGALSFSKQFKDLEEATKLVESYPEKRVLKCFELTKSMDATADCAASKAEDAKIENCALLNFGVTNSLKCLQSNADATTIKSCKYLGLGETNTIKCLEINPEDKVAESCKFLDFGETTTIKCLSVKPNDQVARACKLLYLGETNTLNCISMKPSRGLSESCKSLNIGETNTLKCLTLRPENDVVSACKNLNLGETSTIICLESGVSPESIHQCGLKNLSDSQTLNCLTQSLNEKPASSLVSDAQRAPKISVGDDSEALEIKAGSNNTSK